jgi:hypothetical protein
MEYEVNFGRLGRAPRVGASGTKFRLALLGDFSGRANAGKVEIGAALASRKPLRVEADTLDDVLARQKLNLALPIAEDGGTISIPIASLDDFHPDQLVENVEFFGQLRDLRRNLGSRASFDRAAKEVLSWGGEEPLPPPPRRARGAAVATDRKLSDFARLVGTAGIAEREEAATDDLVRRLVGPFIVAARDTRQDALVARVDEALSAAMRRVLHHPDFQIAEALWRGVELLVRRIETGAKLEIVLYDVSAEELAADLAATDALDQTGLFGMLAEQPAMDANQGPLSALIGLYNFELAPPHADLLGRVAQIAAAANAPFIAAISPDPLKQPMHEQHPLIRDAWGALQALPSAAYLGLAAPRFLLRMPYGKRTDPIDSFGFEEFTRQEGLSGMLWGHPALIPGLLLAETFSRQGLKMKLGSVMSVDEMPYYVYVDPDGDQVALPCTERLWSERQAVQVSSYRVMPLLTIRGRPEVRLGGFTSLAGGPVAGLWGKIDVAQPAGAAPAAAPEEPLPDIDALLAGLNAPVESAAAEAAGEAEVAPPAEAAPAAEADADLDALLASLSAEAPPAAEDATEPDLDALLASLQ